MALRRESSQANACFARILQERDWQQKQVNAHRQDDGYRCRGILDEIFDCQVCKVDRVQGHHRGDQHADGKVGQVIAITRHRCWSGVVGAASIARPPLSCCLKRAVLVVVVLFFLEKGKRNR